MKSFNKPSLVILMVALAGLTLTGCGKSKGNNANNTGTVFPQGPVNPGGPIVPGTPGGCYPISQGSIPFTLNGAYVDSANVIANQQQMFVGGTGQSQGGTLYMSNQWRNIQGMSLIQMSVAPVGNGAYSGQGVVQLSQTVIQAIMMQLGQYGSYACISGMALNAGHNNERLYNGRLYLNIAVNGQSVGTYTVSL